jgi:hypothetical protein
VIVLILLFALVVPLVFVVLLEIFSACSTSMPLVLAVLLVLVLLGVILALVVLQMFVHGRPFQPSLMFLVKARAYPS